MPVRESSRTISGTPEQIHQRMWPKIQAEKEFAKRSEIKAAEDAIKTWEKLNDPKSGDFMDAVRSFLIRTMLQDEAGKGLDALIAKATALTGKSISTSWSGHERSRESHPAD